MSSPHEQTGVVVPQEQSHHHQEHHHASSMTNRNPMSLDTTVENRFSSQEEECSMDEAIDRIGMGRFQYGIMVAAGLCFAADAMEIMLLSFLSLVLQSEWNLSDKQTSFITASVFAGSFLGTLLLGRLGDVWGRKPVCLLTATLVSVFGMGTAVVQTYKQLILCRFMVGIGVGGIGVVFDTLAEFMPTNRRGERIVYTSFFWTFATMMVPVFAYLTLGRRQQQNDGGQQWRLFVVLCALPCLLSALVTVYTVPESPRWVVAKKKDPHLALAILRSAATTNGNDSDELFPPGTTTFVLPSESETCTLSDSLQSPEFYNYRVTLLLLWAVWGSYALLYYGTILAVTLVFFNSNNSDKQLDDSTGYHFDYPAMIISSSAEIVGVVLVLLTVDRFGRIACQVTFFGIGGIVLLVLCWLNATNTTNHDDDNDGNNNNSGAIQRSLLVTLAFLARMFVYSGSSVVWITTAELLPTEIRSTCHSVANAVARIGAFSAPYLVNTKTPMMQIGIFMTLVSIVNIVCTWYLPETAGRPLGALGLRRREGASYTREEFQRVPTEDG